MDGSGLSEISLAGPYLWEIQDWLLGQDATGSGNPTEWHPFRGSVLPGAFCIPVWRDWELGTQGDVEALGCWWVSLASLNTSVSFPVGPAVFLASSLWGLGLWQSPPLGVLCIDGSHLPSCCFCVPTAPTQAAGQDGGRRHSTDDISRHSGEYSASSLVQIMRCRYLSIHLRCVLPQCLSWGDFGSIG